MPRNARITLDQRELCALLCALELSPAALCAANRQLLERVETELKAALKRTSSIAPAPKHTRDPRQIELASAYAEHLSEVSRT